MTCPWCRTEHRPEDPHSAEYSANHWATPIARLEKVMDRIDAIPAKAGAKEKA